jgi:hypothetical protein
VYDILWDKRVLSIPSRVYDMLWDKRVISIQRSEGGGGWMPTGPAASGMRGRHPSCDGFYSVPRNSPKKIPIHQRGAPDLYGTELGSVTLKRVGLFCFPIKHSTHTPTFPLLCHTHDDVTTVLIDKDPTWENFCALVDPVQDWAHPGLCSEVGRPEPCFWERHVCRRPKETSPRRRLVPSIKHCNVTYLVPTEPPRPTSRDAL